MLDTLVLAIAPDSFGGALSSVGVADAIADGWLRARPHDEILRIPMADGGEGTLTAVVGLLGTSIARSRRGARQVEAPGIRARAEG